jgi:hypothetical protein
MTVAIIAAFLVLFLVVVGSATLGMRFYDQRRKKQATDMLNRYPPRPARRGGLSQSSGASTVRYFTTSSDLWLVHSDASLRRYCPAPPHGENLSKLSA